MKMAPNIEAGLAKVSFSRRIAFGASCCERLLPNYLAFYQIEKWGNYGLLRNALDQVWTAIVDNEQRSLLGGISIDEIVALAPDTEDFDTIFTALAGDAASSIVYTIGAYLDPEKSLSDILVVSRLVIDSLFEY